MELEEVEEHDANDDKMHHHGYSISTLSKRQRTLNFHHSSTLSSSLSTSFEFENSEMEGEDEEMGFQNLLLTRSRICANCKMQFLLHLNSTSACRFHPGYFSMDDDGYFWSCCGSANTAAPGCMFNIHVTYDDQYKGSLSPTRKR
jgi:hypothetical protein